MLFMTRKPEKNVPSDMREPSFDLAVIDGRFPVTRLGWDFNMAEGKDHMKVYGQALLAGLKEAAQ